MQAERRQALVRSRHTLSTSVDVFADKLLAHMYNPTQ
jgi:hypothetical protein